MTERVEIGNAVLYHGDCREVLPSLPKVDAVVTDPPYGLGDLWQGGKKKWPLANGGGDCVAWDFAISPWLSVALEKTSQAIVWGGHYYDLPPRRGWLIWDKVVRNFTSGHCEMAWTTLDQPIRAFNYSHGCLASEGKFHPTQKPLPLMEWCLSFLSDAQTVLDPFMGSGTTGVACMNLGRRFIGIELEKRYFDLACERIDRAQRQVDLFAAPAPRAEQCGLSLE